MDAAGGLAGGEASGRGGRLAAPLDRAGDKEDAGGGAGANGPRSRARPVHDEDDLDRSQPSDSVGSGSHGALAQQRLGEWPTGPTPSSSASSGAASSGASSSAASASASAASAAEAAAGALAPAGAAGAGAVGLAGTATTAVDELVVTDNRTGRELRVPISEDGVVAAALFKQLRLNDEDHVGIMLYDPGLSNTYVCRTHISQTDGVAGTLHYRGYSIEDLAERSTFLEVAFLLINGELPTTAEADLWRHKVGRHTYISTEIQAQMATFRYDSHPMGMLIATIASLSTVYPDANPAIHGLGLYQSQTVRNKQIYRILGKVPTIAAAVYRHRSGRPYNPPQAHLGYTENFLYMLDRLAEADYRPDPRLVRALDRMFIVHAEHASATSTAGVRHLASTGVDPYTAISGAAGALFGERRGNAVFDMLASIGSVAAVPAFLADVKANRTRLLGFGHRLFRTVDPRSRIVKQIAREMGDLLGRDRITDVAEALEAGVLEDAFFAERQIFANVDLYTTVVYHTMGFPPDMFPVLFAVPRVAGWLAHWLELLDDPETRIYRPRQIYAGGGPRKFPEIDVRFPADVDLHGESVRSDPEAAKRRETGEKH